MNRRSFNLSTLASAAILAMPAISYAGASQKKLHYALGSRVDKAVEITDQFGQAHSLVDVVSAQQKRLTIIFVLRRRRNGQREH